MVHHRAVGDGQAVSMAEPVRVRRLADEEGRKLQRLVRRGEGKGQASVVRYRRAMVILASAGGNTVPVIARLVQTSEDRVREVIHNFNRLGMACLDPKWAGGRPRRITSDDEAFIVKMAKTRPEKLGRPFTRWSIRKLAGYLADNPTRIVKIGRERLRELLAKHKVTFQRTKTWKESNDPERDAKLDRVEQVMEHHLDRCFAFDEFGPLAIHPVGGCCWAAKNKPQRLRANYHKRCGVRQFHAVYSLGDDTMWGVCRARKSIANSLAAIKSCRAARPDGEHDLRDPRQPLRAQGQEGQGVVRHAQRRAVLHADLQLVGQPDRVSLRAVARVRAEQLRPRQPHRADPPHPLVPRVAQRERPRPRDPAASAQTQSGDPRRATAPLGTSRAPRRLTAGNRVLPRRIALLRRAPHGRSRPVRQTTPA